MRLVIALLGVLVLGGAAAFYAVHASGSTVGTAVEPGEVDLTSPGRLLFRDQSGVVASVPLTDPSGPRRLSPLRCNRFATSNARGLCLTESPGPLPSSVAITVDSRLRETKRVDVAGIPNRARLSPDGGMAAWTTFVTGDSYSSPGAFSTRTAILDIRNDQLASNLESLGLPNKAEDVNFWGVTFTAGNGTFYATVASGGRTRLIRGDVETWRAETLRENVECPSLSPDGTRLAFKKRVPNGLWREHVLDLATMAETPLAETRSIDDQALWLDNDTIAYSLPGEDRTDVWSVPANGAGTPRLLVPFATSPAVIRG